MRSAFILSLWMPLLGNSFQDTQDEKVRPARTLLTAPVSVPFELGRGKAVIQAKINGKGPFRFFLDTGAGGTVLNSDLVTELNLKRIGTTQLGDPNDPTAITADRVHVDKIEIGRAVFEDLEASSFDRSRLYSGEDVPRGVIGFPLFANCLLTLEYPQKRVELSTGSLPEHGKDGIIEFRTPHDIPEIDIQLSGRKLAAHIDSGSMGGIGVNPKVAEGLKFSETPRVIGRVRTVNSQAEIEGARLDGEIQIAGHVTKNPMVAISPIARLVNSGSRTLADYVITFDQRQHRAQFKREIAKETKASK